MSLSSRLPPLARSRRRKASDDDVDITPMIDITFLLLIFFLVTSTPDQDTEVTLPEALYGDAVSQLEATIFTVDRTSGEVAPVYAADGKVPGTELPEASEPREAAIHEAVRAGLDADKGNVVIKADRGVAFRHVSAVIASVSKVDGANLHLAVLDSD
ncbi:MAG: biopolymer transporter ExbD [Planctomycetota bacterium]